MPPPPAQFQIARQSSQPTKLKDSPSKTSLVAAADTSTLQENKTQTTAFDATTEAINAFVAWLAAVSTSCTLQKDQLPPEIREALDRLSQLIAAQSNGAIKSSDIADLMWMRIVSRLETIEAGTNSSLKDASGSSETIMHGG